MGRYIDDDSFLEAEEMFDNLIGYPYAVSVRSEEYSFSKHTRHQIKLKGIPLKIIKCSGYLKYDPLMFDGWVDVPLENIQQIKDVLDIPPSIFQVPFEKVRVDYLVGAVEIPEEICQAIREISKHLENENINNWNLPLSSDTLKVIAKYKK